MEYSLKLYMNNNETVSLSVEMVDGNISSTLKCYINEGIVYEQDGEIYAYPATSIRFIRASLLSDEFPDNVEDDDESND